MPRPRTRAAAATATAATFYEGTWPPTCRNGCGGVFALGSDGCDDSCVFTCGGVFLEAATYTCGASCGCGVWRRLFGEKKIAKKILLGLRGWACLEWPCLECSTFHTFLRQ
ncbi:hypothetical protein L596_006001 [Steinernema carpocapsae]|uniref:Uncharacterized protein n=1 Tax=Steinernema carpocapsae TaxID=34508 RepID=A0A4U8V7I6_STECR|nr:hypothetical protein L596_006001 [Steinernema carpocapsae]